VADIRMSQGRSVDDAEWHELGGEAYLLRRYWRLVAADLSRGCEHTRDWLESEPFVVWVTLSTPALTPAEFAAALLVRYWQSVPHPAPDHTGGYARVLRMQGLLPKRQEIQHVTVQE
jgi:hypothetical protein